VYAARGKGGQNKMAHSKRTRRTIVALSIAAVATLAGYGSSTTTGESGGTGATHLSSKNVSFREVAKTSGKPFKIGYIEEAVSLGAGSTNPYTIPAFQAWAKWQNANGGINGHPIQVVVQREPSNPGIALADVKNMVSQGIVALVSDDTSDESAWTSFVTKAGVPTFEGTSGSVDLAVSPVGFSTQLSLLSTPAAIVAAAKKVGSKEMAVFYCAEIPQCAQAVPALAGAGKKIGVDVPFSSSILGSAPNFTAQCLTAKSHQATSLEIADASQIIIRVAANCAQQGYTPHEITDGLNIQRSFAGAPGLDGLISFEPTMPFFDTSFPGIKTMTDAFNKYDPGVTKMSGYGDLATNQWTTGLLIAAGAKAGGVGTTHPITPAALLQGFYTLHTTTLGGMVPPETFTAGKAQMNKCWFWAATKNKKFVMPYGKKIACAP
jgi:branched-chain amino acid transport system substrate-binding protein